MKCFHHQDRDAVGTCKSCGKGLCPACAVDLGKGLACRGECEQNAQAVIELIDHNIKFAPKAEKMIASSRALTRGIRSGASAFNFVIGLVFLLWGLANPDHLAFLIILGICFLVYATFSFVQSKRIDAKVQQAATAKAGIKDT